MNKKEWKKYYFDYQKNLASKFYIPLLERLNIKISNKSVLDVGCGDGDLMKFLLQNKTIDIRGLEISKKMFRIVYQKVWL